MKGSAIGARLTLRYAVAFAVALAVLGAGTWFTVRQSLYHAIDESLRDRAAGVRIFIEDHKDRLFINEVKEEFRAHGDYFQVRDEQGQWVHRAESLLGLESLTVDGSPSQGELANATVGGAPSRFLSQAFPIDGHVYTVQVAAPLRDLRQGLNDALWVLLPMFPLGLLLASAGGYWMSRRALEPVDQITQAARQIGADNLARRLSVPQTGDELERLSLTFNEMMERLERAFRKVSQFTADASHELRTPLAVVRTTAEVALRGPAQGSEERQALEQIVVELER